MKNKTHHNIRTHFMQLFDEYYQSIYRFLRVKVSTDELAHDLASETFTKAWRHFSNNQENLPENERAYLYRTAYNCMADYYRKTQKKEFSAGNDELISYLDNSHDGYGFGQGSNLDIHIEMANVQTALSKLSEQNAELVTLKYIEDLSNSEIAEVLGKKEGAVRTGLHRALSELKSKLQNPNDK